MPTLEEIIRFSTEVDFLVEIDYLDPETDTEGTFRCTQLKRIPDLADCLVCLLDPGTLDYRLSEDLLFSGPAQVELGEIVLNNTPDGVDRPGPFDSWHELTFAGREVRIYAGLPGESYATFGVESRLVAAGRQRIEPLISPSRVRIGLQSPMERLNVPLKVNRYVGIPTCLEFLTATGRYSAPHIAAYNLTTFTLVVRFRIAAATALNQEMVRKSSGTTNFDIYMRPTGGADAGQIWCAVGLSGVFTVIHATSSSYADGQWHTVVFSLLDKTTSYLMIDGTVLNTYTPAVSVDTQTAPIDSAGVSGSLCDVRAYNTYLTPDEARSKTATFVAGSDPGLVALWPMDDGAGASAGDSSPNNNDAALSGTINVDYRWVSSDLGMPEQAGRPMPAVHGIVYNFPVHLVNSALERHRWHDGQHDHASQCIHFNNLKSRGVALALTTDWNYSPDASSGVLQMVAEEDEPVTANTVDSVGGGDDSTDAAWAYLPLVLRRFWEQRGELTAPDDIDATWLTGLEYIQRGTGGIFVDQETTLAQVSAEFTQGSGSFIFTTPKGKLSAYALLPNIGYGPYGEPAIEITGEGTPGLNFGNIGGVSGSHSICLWVFRHSLGYGVAEDLVEKSNRSTRGYRIRLSEAGPGDLSYTEYGVSATTAKGVIKLGVWTFVAVTWNDSTKVMKIYAAEDGRSLIEVSTKTTSGSTSTGADNFTLGGSTVCGLQHVQLWNSALSLAQLQALMDVPPAENAAGLVSYVPGNEGSETPEEVVTSTVASSFYGRWAPRVTFDLDTLNADFDWRLAIERDHSVGYQRNYRTMTPADIAASVSQTEALSLGLPHLSVPNPRIGGEQTVIVSPFKNRSDASSLNLQLLIRLRGKHVYANLRNAGRDAVLLRLTDEVAVVSSSRGIGMIFRVIERSARFGGRTADLRLWGEV